MTISVAMINYNNGDFLKTSIESVLAQSRLPDELVICDDGSTDNSWEMAQEFQKTKRRKYLNAFSKLTAMVFSNSGEPDWDFPL